MTLESMIKNTTGNSLVEESRRAFRFDIFKGVIDGQGKIQRVKSVGAAYLVEGSKTYAVYLKTFLNERFYLLPEEKRHDSDFAILTREASRNLRRKYFWNNVGQGKIMSGENSGFVHLEWDILGCDGIYLNLYPKQGPADSQIKEAA